MTIESLLLILVPVLAALGTIILGLGQQQHALSVVAVFAAVTSAVFTDWLKWFRLHTAAANFAALAAVGFSFLRLTDVTSESQLISVANLLIYLQMVLLYQQKNLRIYWNICLLSLLQVVVAAALELGPQFGALLVVYLFLTLLTMAFLFIRGESRLRSAKTDFWGLQHSQLGMSTSSENVAPTASSIPAAVPVIEVTTRDASSVAFENRMLNRQLIYRLVMLGVSTLLLTTLLFFLVPRFGDKRQRMAKGPAQRLVGFSPQVNLGEIGKTLESPEVVMRAQFTHEDGRPFNVLVDPYFRGNVLSKYVPQQGIWLDAGERFYVRSAPLGKVPEESTVAVQTVVLESQGPLFSVFPAYDTSNLETAFGPTRQLRSDRHRMLLLEEDEREKAKQFSVATTAFRNGIQRRLTPASRTSSYPGRLTPLLDFRSSDFPNLKKLAAGIVADSEIEEGDHQAVAKLIESYFKTTGGYRYSLTQETSPPVGTDPLEYFVSETRTGHCEYFASALVMMLRSIDIPARIVIGFRGGEYNRMGHFFLVRQLHAHAWVEAYLSPQQLEEFGTFDELPTKYGAWLRLDPTPSLTTHNVDVAKGGILKRFSQIGDFLEVLWKDYVVGLNSTRQREAIYRPIVERTSASLRGVLLNPDWWMLFAAELRGSLGLDSLKNFRTRWVNWRSVPLLAGVFFGLLLLRRLWRRVSPIISPWFAKRFRKRRQTWAKDPQLAWYRKLERFLAGRGLRRQAGQTHREFMTQACEALSERSESECESDLSLATAHRLVDGFYKVRFGARRLSASELAALEKDERQWEAAAVGTNGKG